MKILICFDGTGNQPRDAEQELDENSVLEDDNVSNVLKIHCFAGGDLSPAEPVREAGGVNDQLSLYFSGVGTRGSAVRRIFRKAFALSAPRVIQQEALDDLEEVYEKGDELYVFGFSRGAAIARLFASTAAESGLRTRSGQVDASPVIKMLGVWDTVASFNKPEIGRDDPLPAGEELGESGRIAPIIEKAYHLVSLDEKRLAFRPTLMNAEERVCEIWFPGVHSDVGGGFREDGLSDLALRFMIDAAEEEGLDFLPIEELPEIYLAEDQDGEKVEIGRDDLVVTPDVEGILHQQDRSPAKSRILLEPRDLIVLRDDAPSSGDRPVIHHTVLDRIAALEEYRPESLQGEFDVLEKDGTLRPVRL